MRALRAGLHRLALLAIACLLASHAFHTPAAQPPGQRIIPELRARFGLSDMQVRGALGALLVYVRDRLPAPEFNQLAQSIPDAEQIMQEVKLQGIVTRPLDDLEEYQQALSSLRITQSVASQFPQAVVEALGAAGYVRERDILARVLS